jgi:hypothetical protein
LVTYYKVLVDGKSCHGGNMTWSLPVQQEDGSWLPGDEMRVEGKLSICEHGLHLTTEPDKWWKLRCRYYEAEITGEAGLTEADKTVVSACRLLREVPVPDYLQRCEALIDEIEGIKWFSQIGPIDPAWKLFTKPTYAAARDAAWDAARAAAWDAARGAAYGAAYDAARDAARDAALLIGMQGVCVDLPIEQKHRDYAKACMEVWRRGYGLLCDVDGVLYVYGVKED